MFLWSARTATMRPVRITPWGFTSDPSTRKSSPTSVRSVCVRTTTPVSFSTTWMRCIRRCVPFVLQIVSFVPLLWESYLSLRKYHLSWIITSTYFVYHKCISSICLVIEVLWFIYLWFIKIRFFNINFSIWCLYRGFHIFQLLFCDMFISQK